MDSIMFKDMHAYSMGVIPLMCSFIKIVATVLEESWCWENESLEFQVAETDVSDLQFVQSGYILKCILSHNITLVC